MSKMLDEFMKSFERNVVEGKEVVEEKKRQAEAEASTNAIKEAHRIEQERILLERRRTRLGELAANIKYLPMVEQIIDIHYMVDGINVFARTTDGNAYEFMIRPAEYAKSHQVYRKSSKPKPVDEAKTRRQKRLQNTDPNYSMVDGRFVGGVDTGQFSKKKAEPKKKPVAERNGNHAAHIVITPDDAKRPDDDGAVERAPKDKDVKKNLKQVAKDYDVHYVKDFSKYTKKQ